MTIQVPDGVTLTLNKTTRYAANPWVLVAGAESNLVYRVYWRGLLLSFFSWPSCFFNKAEVVTISTTLGSQKISTLTRKGCKWWQAYMQPPEKVDGIGLKNTFKKSNLPESPFLPLAASLVQLLLLEFDPPIDEKVPRSHGQKILKAAGLPRCLEGSLLRAKHWNTWISPKRGTFGNDSKYLPNHQQIHVFVDFLSKWLWQPAMLQCWYFLVLIWWKRMDRVIIPFWVDRQFQTGTGHGPVVSSTPTCVLRNAQVNFFYNNLTWMHTISYPRNTVPTPPCWKKICPTPPTPPPLHRIAAMHRKGVNHARSNFVSGAR